ncbi:type II toxin-antitoxin system RelE/ParE family toxin [uncultured Methanomethylovorans sp.]|uniref:type II toxin-antitoxin system RelE family toxin n=1 Tax=uncultured Methanomethylovorans sp. TaxID=183759 RepID=UPI003748CA37
MSYKGIFTNAFKKDLNSIHKKNPKDLELIVHSIEQKLLLNPFSDDTKQLQCFEFYRYRVGKYRIVFELIDSDTIAFLAVDSRASIYTKLRHRFNKC